MQRNGAVTIVGVASPYAWDVVESASRAGLDVRCFDNFGGADIRLPGLETLTDSSPRDMPFVIGLASAPHRALAITDIAAAGFAVPEVLVDPTAIVAGTTHFGHCVYVNAGVVIGSNTSVGCATNINRSASVGHDNTLGFAVSVAPGAVLAGGITVQDLATVGAGATVLPGIVIGRGAVVGAGAVVTRDVNDFDVVVGNPARLLRAGESKGGSLRCPYC